LKDYGPGLVSDFTVLKDFGEVIPSVIKEQQSSIGLMQYDIRGKHLHQDSLKGRNNQKGTEAGVFGSLSDLSD
jgi:hypothetical protein